MGSTATATDTSARLRRLLEERDRSIGWLSRESGIHYEKLRRIMQGRAITLDEALALSRVLGVPVETFATERCGESEGGDAS